MSNIARIERLAGRAARASPAADQGRDRATGPARLWRNECIRDMLVMVAVIFGAFIVSIQFDLAERYHEFSRANELYEFDELPIIALAAAAALAWFAFRQCQHLRRELTRRINLERELIDGRVKALELIESKSSFLANLSHEFRTPLNAIHGFADLMKNEIYGPLANENYAEYIEYIRQSSTILIELVDEVIDLEKIGSGQETLAERPCCFRQAVMDILPIVEPAARSGNIRIVNNVPSGIGKVLADPRAIQKMVLNLMTNAVKYNRPGGSVTLSAHIENVNEYVFEVDDTGIGIQRREIKKVLEPFHRGGSPLVRSKEGSGLGLNIVNKLASLHDASFTLRSRPNKGTTASLRFPPERFLARKHMTDGVDPETSSAA